jgi:hypothetical protein
LKGLSVTVVVSPELALVDEELRAAACVNLPPLDPDAFLGCSRLPPSPCGYSRARNDRIVRWRVRARTLRPWSGIVVVAAVAGVLVGHVLNG